MMKINSFICKTKYPIVLVHGIGFRTTVFLSYWGRIPKALKSKGAKVFCCNQDAWGTIEENAVVVKQTILNILSKTGYEKVNIIAHSKGGLDSRYMISALQMDEYIASLTTISSPHHGSKTMDFVCMFPKFLLKFIGLFVNSFFKLLGDKKPDFYNTCKEVTTKHCKEFNEKIINSDKVYYQSYASIMKNSFNDILLLFTHFIVKLFDGENDGLVSVDSAKWGTFRGVIKGTDKKGISHAEIIDLVRTDYYNINIRKIYVLIVNDLKKKGF